ncbi:hypothetical protein D1006_32900 [Burkholderia stabilis]|uniref:Uncharacterized protein n=1 Tax=Burkholderia stabilis TaxID=95485 RepID=A0A4Q2A6K5_9BURK|nr:MULTISPECIES: hypothetical protein [Burkholderia]RXV64982.1 hypothetical protein D1006_32900 [Burkholderia stabilis]
MTKNSERRELIRRELVHTSEQICSKRDQSGLGLVLRGFLPNLERAFIVQWLPEQAEDIYWILISATEIAKAEIPRSRLSDDEHVLLQTIDIATFRKKRLSREAKEKLEIALELMGT